MIPAVLMGLSAGAVAGEPVDLDLARGRATEAALDVARADAEAARARGSTLQTLSGALPTVSLFATASTGAGLTSFGFERPVQTQLGAGAQGSWTLLAPGTWAATDAARHSARGSRALVDWARVGARRDATVAVADLWSAIEQERAWTAATEDAERAAEAVSSLVESGLRPSSDAARTQANLASLRARAVEAGGLVTGRCAALQSLMRIEIDGECPLTPPAAEDATGPVDSSGEHPALVAAEEALSAAKSARVAAILDRAPTITANGTVAQYVAGDASGVGWNAGIQATLPLISGGAGLGSNQVAAAQKDDATLALEAQQRDLTAARIAAEARYRAATAGLEALTASFEAAEEALVLVDGRYREGLVGLEPWLSARRDRDEARVALAEGRAEQLRALAELESVRGVW